MADFEQHKASFDAIDTEIIALSADRNEEARESIDQLGLEFPVIHSLDPESTSRTIGSYTGTRQGRKHLQPAAFVLSQDGRVVHAVYSSGKVGRLTSHDVLALLQDAPVAKRGAVPST